MEIDHHPELSPGIGLGRPPREATFRNRIFAKVLLWVCASVFVILFLSFYAFERIEYAEQKNELISQQKFITQSQAIIIPRYILGHDEERITLILSGILSNPSIIGVTLFDPEGNVLYRIGKFDSDTARVFEASRAISNFDGSGVHALGSLMTAATDRHIVANLERRREFYGLVFAVLFIVIVIATYASIHWNVAIPLNRMVMAIKRSKDGEPISVDWTSRDEIGLVISEFQNLQARQFEVQSRLRDELERSEKILADLRIMKEAAEQASRAKSEFLATMSHELRTPLNAIIGLSEIMKSQLAGPIGPPEHVEYVRNINESGVHLLSIINDILDMSKIEAGEMRLAAEPVAFKLLAESAILVISHRAERGSVALATEVPDDLPHLIADPRMIKQILLNLLSNAVKFTPPGGSVTLSAAADETGVVVAVRDTGIGIPADKIDLVVEPFAQLDSRLERQYEGTGLGLPLVKSLVELHDGTLEIRSAVGVGTTVEVRLPPQRICRERAPEALVLG